MWGNPQSDTHPYAPLATTMHGHQWSKVRSRKFASDVSLDGVLEVVEFTWFLDDSVAVSVSHTAYSVSHRRKRVVLYLFFTPSSASRQCFSSPDYTFLADDCTVCNLCSSDICICPEALAPSHSSHSNCFIIPSTLRDGSQEEAHFFVHTWHHRYRMTIHGSKHGVLTIIFNPFSSEERRKRLTMQQEFISICQDQNSVSGRIEQHITDLLSKLPQMQTSLSATPVLKSTSKSGSNSVKSTPKIQKIMSCEHSPDVYVPSSRAPITCAPTSDTSNPMASSSKMPSVETPQSATDARWHLERNRPAISTSSGESITGSRFSKLQAACRASNESNHASGYSSVCAPEKIGKACACSAEDMANDSLAILLNPGEGAGKHDITVLQNSTPIDGNLHNAAEQAASIQVINAGESVLKRINQRENKAAVIGNIDSNSSVESTACDPISSRSGASLSSGAFGRDGSPLNGMYALCGRPAMKRPRIDPSTCISLMHNSWESQVSPVLKDKEFPPPSWSLTSLPSDRPLSTIGRALGSGRSPSPFGATGLKALDTPPQGLSSELYAPGNNNNSSNNNNNGPICRNLSQGTLDYGSTVQSLPPLRLAPEYLLEKDGEGSNWKGRELSAKDLDRSIEQKKVCSIGEGGLNTDEKSSEAADGIASVGMIAGGGTMKGSSVNGNGVCCEICGITFAKRGNKVRHILTVHNRLKQFECDQCGAKFGLKADLGRHRYRIHESRSFSCEACGKSFAEESQLKLHVRITHEKDAHPWECKECHIHFGRKSSLTRHELTVHRHTRFVCRVCQKSYSQKFDAIRHERRAHGLNDKGGGVPQKQ